MVARRADWNIGVPVLSQALKSYKSVDLFYFSHYDKSYADFPVGSCL